MSKKIFAGVAVLGVAYVGASWYCGKHYEDSTYKIVQNANHELRQQLGTEAPQIAIAQYDRGIFGSKAVYKLTIGEDNQGLELNDAIQHGPIPGLLKAQPKLGLAFSSITLDEKDDYAELYKMTQQQSPFTLDTLVSYNLNTHSTLSLVPIKDGKTVSFAGAEFKLNTHNQLQDFDVTGSIGAIEFVLSTGGLQRLELSPVTFSGYLKDLDSPIQSSSAEFHVESIKTLTSDGIKSHLHQLSFKHTDAATNNLLKFSGQYDLKDLTIDGKSIGQFSLAYNGDNLDLKIYNELKNLTNVSLHGTPEELQAAQTKAGFLAIEMLNKNPELSFAPVTWTNSTGSSSAAFHLKLGAPQGLNILANPEQAAADILQDIGISFDVSLPMLNKLAESFLDDEQLARFQEQFSESVEQANAEGMTIQKGDHVTFALSFKNGLLTLNNQEIAPEDFLTLVELVNGSHYPQDESDDEEEYEDGEYEDEDETLEE